MPDQPTQEDPTQTTDDALNGVIQQIIAAGNQGQTQSIAPPIGVPAYQIDPTTGMPYIGADGQPIRWSAHPQIPNDVNTMGSQGGLVHAGGGFDSVSPRYYDGDQWQPASLPPAQLAALQKAMVEAGLLKPGEAQLGVWDVASMNAYERLLGFANASGLDVAHALQRWGEQHQANPSEDAAPRTPLTVRVSNPEDLRQVFRKSVIDTLGQGWDTEKIDKMIAAYQQVETEAQQQQYAMTGSGSQTDPGQGGTITTPPSADAFAVAQARTEDPTGAQEHDALGFIGQFRQLVGGWQG